MTRSETAFRASVVAYAVDRGWEWMHVRPARTNRPGVWKTPVDGTLGTGWPDLVLVRGGRTVAIECKTRTGVLSDAQRRVLDVLAGAGWTVVVLVDLGWDAVEPVLSAALLGASLAEVS